MIKRLAGCIRAYKKQSILGPVFGILEVVMEVVIPFLMAWMIDRGISTGDMDYILRLGIVLIICALLAMVFGILSGRMTAVAASGFAKNVRRDIYFNVQNFSFANIDKYSTSGLVTRMTTDVTNLQNAYMMILRIAVRAPAMIIFSLIMAFGINVKLSLVFLAALPVLAASLLVVINKSHPIFERVFKIYDRLNRVVQENVRGIRVVKSFVREEHEVKKFGHVSEDIYKDFSKAEKILAFNAPAMQFCMYACIIIISWLAAKMIVGETGMTTGQLMSLFSYCIQSLMSLMLLSMVFVMITISRASAERIVETLDEKSSLTNCENPVMDVPDGSLSFENVTFSYGPGHGKPALRDISLSIKSGQTVGIIGGTGSAKSTLVQLIPRLYDVKKGQVLVGGRDVREYDIEALRDSVAVVLQKNVLFSGTIKDNLRWGNPDASDEELIHVSKLAQADDFVRTFPDGYDTYIEQGGSNVSGGQKQRLCIARALLKKPKILILDDSTSAVDTKTDALIRKAFREEIPDTTKIIIAQRISSVEDADLIVVMDSGKVNGIGTHEELLETNEIYKEVYASQQKGGDGNDAA